LPDEFVFYICCIGTTENAKKLIKSKFIKSEDKIIFNSKYNSKYNIKSLTLTEIFKTKLWNNKNIFNKSSIEKIFLENDIFILVIEDNEIKIKSILHEIAISCIYNPDKLTMTYLFCKYPDYASTITKLCGFNIFTKEKEYYIIKDANKRVINYNFEKNNYIHYFSEYMNKSNNLEKILKNIINTDNNLIKCINNNTYKFYGLINNIDYKKINNNKINNYDLKCIDSFYKKIDWMNKKKEIINKSTKICTLLDSNSLNKK
jgi:hypothetical protein